MFCKLVYSYLNYYIGYTKRLVNQIHQPFFVSGHFPIPII